eukprot:1143037-Pelagomonas_calceolata.AAC.2
MHTPERQNKRVLLRQEYLSPHHEVIREVLGHGHVHPHHQVKYRSCMPQHLPASCADLSVP